MFQSDMCQTSLRRSRRAIASAVDAPRVYNQRSLAVIVSDESTYSIMFALREYTCLYHSSAHTRYGLLTIGRNTGASRLSNRQASSKLRATIGSSLVSSHW